MRTTLNKSGQGIFCLKKLAMLVAACAAQPMLAQDAEQDEEARDSSRAAPTISEVLVEGRPIRDLV